MDAGVTSPLFRSEALEARQQRVFGEIVLTQPVSNHVLVLLLFGIISALALWVSLGTYTRTETARGILVTDATSAKVVAVRPGIVTRLSVREGQYVRAGQTIATVRTEQASETGASAVAQSLGALDAQLGLTRDQMRLAGERAAGERARVAATLAGLSQQRSDLAGQIALQEEAVASAKGLFDRIQSVVEKGFVSKIEVERRRQAWVAARQELARLRLQSNAAAAEAGRASAELARISADASAQIVEARAEAQSIAQREAQLRGERAYSIAAPVSGRVTALQAAVGRTVEPSLPMMVIVPDGSALHADVYAPTRAIGFVRPGQEVRLLYDAFPYQRFGSFKGRIAAISRTVLDPRELAVPLRIEEPVYRIEVAPGDQSVAAFGERMKLQPGMTVTASIVLDRRSFLDWLLQPLNAVLRRNEERAAA
ncbi:MAG TPA: HlyD family efflux transporter periplasmic adaptor subunit [Allosphingosinicella sp.]|jgi:membrane fusion protein|nr:HlyD family efflux transporter periplasmic adaptor subunit [Allosphingosinicella sp.]